MEKKKFEGFYALEYSPKMSKNGCQIHYFGKVKKVAQDYIIGLILFYTQLRLVLEKNYSRSA